MANRSAVVLVNGIIQNISSSDVLVSSGFDFSGALTIGTSSATSIGIGKSGITTTITGGLTQLTGAISLTGNAASSLITSVGAITVDGYAGVVLKNNGSPLVTLNSTGTQFANTVGINITPPTSISQLQVQAATNLAAISI